MNAALLDPYRYFSQPQLERVRPAIPEAQVSRDLKAEMNKTKWAKCYAFLRKAKYLASNWDGDEAIPPGSDTVDSLIYYFQFYLVPTAKFPGPTRMAVTPDGALFIEWQEDGLYMDLEATLPGRAEFLIMEDNQPPKQESVRWSVPVAAVTLSAVVALPFTVESKANSSALASSWQAFCSLA